MWQSEWASDFMFKNQADLDDIMYAAVRHAFIAGHPERLLHWFGHPLKKNGQPRSNFTGSLKTTILKLDEGYRIRHWFGSNSVKMYNELNNLRVESTVNNPYAFRAYRHKQRENKDAAKKLRPIRKGVADIALRAQASQSINNRFADHVAATRSSQSFRTVLASVTQRRRKRGRSVRALVPTGKDLALLTAVADPRFTVNGFRNKDLRGLLADDERYVGKTKKQRSGMTTRSLRLLRDHGVIRRLPKARRYQLTSQGRQLVTTLQAALAASTEQLMAIAA